jgi:hypothetical protein
VAVVKGVSGGFSPAAEGGVVIYDDGSARPTPLCGTFQILQNGCSLVGILNVFDSIQWNAEASEMFSANNETTGSAKGHRTHSHHGPG